MTDHCYVAVKGSLHATDASVFGLTSEEIVALSKRFSDTFKEVINGVLIKGSPIEVINALGEIGYRVICSSGEAEIIWTLRRDFLDDKKSQKAQSSYPVGKVLKGESTSRQRQPSTSAPSKPLLVTESFPPQRPPGPELKEAEKIGSSPEEMAEYAAEKDLIMIRNLESVDKIPVDEKIIVRTNLSSDANPLALRNIYAQQNLPSKYQISNRQMDSRFAPDQQMLNESSTVLKVIHPDPESRMAQHFQCDVVCTQNVANPTVHQTMDEMDFERGIWNAALQGDMKRVGQLLQKGVNPDVEDASGYTALHYAARNGHTGICVKLIKAGANVNAVTRAGMSSPLHRAAMAGNGEIIELLLNSGANPGLQDSDGRTPLHRATEEGHASAVQMLLKAYPRAASTKDCCGKTPLMYAQGNAAIEKLLTRK